MTHTWQRGGSKRPSPPEIQQYLAGLDYPATKKVILQYVADGKAPQSLLSALNNMLIDRTYVGPTDLNKEIGAEN